MADELSRLRAEAMKRQKAANAKVARLRRSKGVEISGTVFDIRKDPAQIKRYNRRQLTNYVNSLNKFINRNTGFEAGAEGSPLPKHEWALYKIREARKNAIGVAHYDTIGVIDVPGATGLKVKDRQENMARKRANGSGAAQPFVQSDLKPNQIKDVDSLRKLSRDVLNKTKVTYNQEQINKQRAAVDKMLTKMGNPEQIEWIRKLTDNQFDIMWNYLDFAKDLVPYYVRSQYESRDESDDLLEAMDLDGNYSILTDLQEAAEKLPKTPRGRQDDNVTSRTPKNRKA